MENQHRKINGYRELGEAEISMMNQIKGLGSALGAIVDHLEGMDSIDKRWLSIGKTDLQKGIMSLVRSVAQPTTF